MHLSPIRAGFLACVLLMTTFLLYAIHLQYAFDRTVYPVGRVTRWQDWPRCPIQAYANITFSRVGETTNRTNCPIPANVEVCIHSRANSEDIQGMCGNIKVSVGDCQDRFYGMIVTTKDTIEDVSEHTYMMVVQGVDIGGEMDGFVQKRSRWVIDTMGGSGYEILTSFADKERLALNGDLDRLQHRCDNFFNGAVSPFGFGSNWHNLGLGLAYSQYYNMTLYSPGVRRNFIPMTTCSESEMKKSFQAHPPETKYTQWSSSTVNFRSPGEDVALLMRNKTIIRPEYEHKGHFWWRSMLTYYAIRPNAQLRHLIRKTSTVSTPCMSMHVRHSDKGYETALIDLSAYMQRACEYRAKTGISDIYLMTDDHQVIEATKNYTDFRFHYLDIPRTNKGWGAEEYEGESREQQEKSFLVDIFSAVRCQHYIVTYSSNVGRLIGEIAYVVGNKEPDVVSLDQPWEMAP